ncbi:MAG: AAA family ATPase [Succinatimonas sp.]|nr:AAA family ATPase [Succinatimonas sp.]
MALKDVKLSKLPLGKTAFENFKKLGFVYVDKTDLIAKLAQDPQPTFLSRPRRFGKSTLIDTLEVLFSKGKEAFKGYKLYDIWESTDTYPVIHLDFSAIQVNDYQTVVDTLIKAMSEQFKKYGFDTSDVATDKYPATYFNTVLERYNGNVVILIDEYDNLLIRAKNISDDLYKKVLELYNDLFNIIKLQSGKKSLFTFVTGILKLSQTSIFSGSNSFQDVSFNSEYSTLLGYTQEEIHEYFDEYIENFANVNSITKEEVYLKLKENYNGYSFDAEAKTSVYNPWSILNCLKNPTRKFDKYWIETGSPESLLKKRYVREMNSHKLDERLKPLIEFSEKSQIFVNEKDLTSKTSIDDISDISLLYQAGFLTIKGKNDFDQLLIDYPNLEVKSCFAQILFEKIFKSNQATSNLSNDIGNKAYIEKILCNGDVNAISTLFSNILRVIGYDARHELFLKETLVTNLINCVLEVQAIQTYREKQNISGRSDLEVIIGKEKFVFDFKLADNSNEIEAKKQEAFAQIKKHHYGQDLNYPKPKQYAVIINKDAQDSNFVSVIKLEN